MLPPDTCKMQRHPVHAADSCIEDICGGPSLSLKLLQPGLQCHSRLTRGLSSGEVPAAVPSPPPHSLADRARDAFLAAGVRPCDLNGARGHEGLCASALGKGFLLCKRAHLGR